MKKLLLLTLAAITLTAALPARAWTYQDENVLLVFRKPGYNNVLFNLGNISQFLNKPAGYSAAVTGWDLSLLTGTLGSDLSSDVRVAILATTSSLNPNRRAWISSAEPNTQPYDHTPSQWQSQLYSKINAIGDKPQSYTQTSAVPSYVISPSHISSYDYIASNAHQQDTDLPKLGGAVTFTVEGAIPASLLLWEITPAGAATPATIVGTFTLDLNGVLSFVAGPPATAPSILGISRTNDIAVVTFSTSAGRNYQLHYNATLGTSVTNWPAVGSAIIGTGSPVSVSHTNSGATGFYSVERYP